MINLEVNKKYLTRDNRIVEVISIDNSSFTHYPCIVRNLGPNGGAYYCTKKGSAGSFYPNPNDLVSEYILIDDASNLTVDEIMEHEVTGPGRLLSKCTCIMHGPTGLMAIGCTCGGK